MGIYCTPSHRPVLCGVLLAAAVGVSADVCAQEASAAPLNSALLSGEAFASARGVVTLNQAAGTGNVQQNTVQMGRSLTALGANDAVLAVRPGGGSALTRSGEGPSRNVVVMARGVLEGASGVVQVSQVAGSANLTSNAISIRITP